MLGYMTKAEALENGFTHHGRYYGIPLWITDEICPVVATKWYPMEFVMDLFHVIEITMRSLLFPDDELVFQFQIGMPINSDDQEVAG